MRDHILEGKYSVETIQEDVQKKSLEEISQSQGEAKEVEDDLPTRRLIPYKLHDDSFQKQDSSVEILVEMIKELKAHHKKK